MPVHSHPLYRDSGDLPYKADAKLADRLRASFKTVQNTPGLIEGFYEDLFAEYPSVRPMFKNDPKVQAEKLLASLGCVVNHLADPAGQHDYLWKLGADHAKLGVLPEHYGIVVQLLTRTLARGLPESEPDLIEDWRTALWLVADQMMAGARSAV